MRDSTQLHTVHIPTVVVLLSADTYHHTTICRYGQPSWLTVVYLPGTFIFRMQPPTSPHPGVKAQATRLSDSPIIKREKEEGAHATNGVSFRSQHVEQSI